MFHPLERKLPHFFAFCLVILIIFHFASQEEETTWKTAQPSWQANRLPGLFLTCNIIFFSLTFVVQAELTFGSNANWIFRCFRQVRIKIVKGRQLAGANIHPVVKVSLGKESKQTRVKSATNRPHYDEVFKILEHILAHYTFSSSFFGWPPTERDHLSVQSCPILFNQ